MDGGPAAIEQNGEGRALARAYAAADYIDAEGRNERLTAATVQAVLYQGVSADGFDGGDRRTENRLVTILRAEPGDGPCTEVLVCGAVSRATVHEVWGDPPRHDCP